MPLKLLIIFIALFLGLEAGADDCVQFKSTLPRDYKSATIKVPEDWNQPNGAQIDVFFYYSNAAESDTPIVFFNGGPTANSHGSFRSFRSRAGFGRLAWVFIDQRGTGCSTPYPSGARLANYGSRAIVKDAEAIRRTFFASRSWKVFGQSFGALIVQRYAAIAPTGLAGGFAHAFSLVSDPVSMTRERQLAQIRVWKDYAARFPGDEAKLARARSAIATNTCFRDGLSSICGPEILDGLFLRLGFQSSWNSIHAAIESLVDARGSLDLRGLEAFAREFVLGVFFSASEAEDVITRLELTPGESDLTACQKALRRMTPVEVTGAPILECRLLIAIARDNPNAGRFPAPITPDPLTAAQLSHGLALAPLLKFFLYSGKRDVYVPVSTFAEELAVLGSRVIYREFASGHEGFSSEPQVLTDIRSVR